MCVADTKLKYTAAHIKAASITASTVLKLNFMWPPTSRVLLYYFFLKKPSIGIFILKIIGQLSQALLTSGTKMLAF